MKRTELVSVVIPVFNEEAQVEELLRRCLATLRGRKWAFEIVLVDDGSSDRSLELMEKAVEANPGEVVCVVLNRNYGQHAAVLAGFEEARGDLIVTIDADLQNPPEEVPKLVDKALEGYDVVGSIRIQRDDSLLRRMPSFITNKMIQLVTKTKMRDHGCMLRAYRRNIVAAMLACNERSTFIPVLANSFARRTAEVEVEHASRASGKSKYGFWKLINLQFDLLTSMTTLPLRLLSILGGAISVCGIGFGLFLLLMRLVYGAEWAAQGVFTLLAILFTLMGLQFIGMGLLGEYIGRIYHDVRARPRSFVERVVGRAATNREGAEPVDRGGSPATRAAATVPPWASAPVQRARSSESL